MKERHETDYVNIKIEVVGEEGGWCGWPNDPDFPELSGAIAQASTRDCIVDNIRQSIKAMMSYYSDESRRYAQRAIFRGNYTKHQLWFTIVGVGMIFYWRSKEVSEMFPKLKPKYQFHIGRLWFTFRNEWKIKKK